MAFEVKRTGVRLAAIAILVAVLAAVFLIDWQPERTRRENFVQWCNEEGGTGATFTSREYCEELYDRNQLKR